MKRFYLAVIILILIVSTSIFLNFRAYRATMKIIECTENGESISEINNVWDKNEIWLNLIISDELLIPLETSIRKLDYSQSADKTQQNKENIIISAQKIKESLKIELINVF